MIKVISFDIWRTILRIEPFYLLINERLKEITKKEPKEDILKVYKEALKARLKGEFKRPVYDSALFFSKKLGVSVDELLKATAKAILDDRIEELKYDDAGLALKELHGRVRIAFLGNVLFWPGMVTRIILERNGLLKYANITIFGDEVGIQKPDKRIFELLAEITGSRVDEIIHVGDSLTNDFSGALLAGIKAVLIKRDIKEDLITLNSKAYIVRDLRSVAKLI